MRKQSLPVLLCVWSAAATLHAAGLASNNNFIVQAPTQKLAEEVAAKADEFRGQLARKWLGAPLPDGQGRTLLHVQVSAEDRSGHFWRQESPRRKMHSLWIVCTDEEARGSWLKRNIVKVVLETAHGGRLPPAVVEGIAATCDDDGIAQQRRQLLRWFARTGRWPDAATLLNDKHLDETDRGGLAAAASLTEFFLSRSDEGTLLDFAMAGHGGDWPGALRSFYGIQDTAQLQQQWQNWVSATLTDVAEPQQEFADPKYRVAQHNAALAINETFTIYARDRQMCLELLAAADKMRDQIAREWLGEPLPPGVGHTIIRVKLSGTEDHAITWFNDPSDRVSQMMWITASPDQIQPALAHEVAHAVFATRFAYDLPVFAHEGAASQQDDPHRKAQRAEFIQQMARTRNWASIEATLNAPRIDHDDLGAYAVAASLTEMLVARGGKAKFLTFAVDGKRDGWPAALRKHYGIRDVAALQASWQRFATGQFQ